VLVSTASLGVGLGAATILGCGGGGGSANQAEEAKRVVGSPDAIKYTWELPDESKDAKEGGTYKTTGPELTGGFDPYVSTNFTTRGVADLVYEQFLGFKAGPGIDTAQDVDLEGRLAETWEQTNDGLLATLKMRQNVKWHNLSPVNARLMDIDDVKASLERFLSVGVFKSSLNDVLDKIEYPDAKTVTIKTKQPYAPLLKVLAGTSLSFYLMPKEAAGKGMDPATTVIGTGYRQLDKYEPAIAYTYSRNPNYWRAGKPLVPKWTYSVIPEYANSYAQFIAGNLDAFAVKATDILQLKKDLPSTVLQRSAPGTYLSLMYFGLKDWDTSAWKDDRVRQAISMHLDREGIDKQFYINQPLEDAGIHTDIRWGSHISGGRASYWLDPRKNELGDASKYWQLNLDEAVKLIDAAGFKNGFDLTVNWNGGGNYGANYPSQAQVTQDMLAKSGRIKVKSNSPPYADWFANYYNDGAKRAFSGVALWGNNLPGSEIDTELYESWHSKATNFFKGYPDPKVDDFIQRQRVELDTQKRITIIQDLQKYMAEKLYAYPWLPGVGTISARSDRVRNLSWPSWNWWLSA
jgi:peptide/nickel transport system substrate-binding protein